MKRSSEPKLWSLDSNCDIRPSVAGGVRMEQQLVLPAWDPLRAVIGWSGPVPGSDWSRGGRGDISRGGGQRPSVEDDGGGWVQQHNTEDARAREQGRACCVRNMDHDTPWVKQDQDKLYPNFSSPCDFYKRIENSE